jgi:hypothetical protein
VNLNLYSRRMQVLSALILSLFALGPAIAGQSAIGLKIVVLESSGAPIVVLRQAQRPIKLRIVDANNRAVSGATVLLTTPATGPSGFFLNGSHSMIVFTNQQGYAEVPDYHANSDAGGYQIQIQAAYMGEVANLSIEHTNIVARKSSGKMFLIGAAAGGAAAAVFAAKANSGR